MFIRIHVIQLPTMQNNTWFYFFVRSCPKSYQAHALIKLLLSQMTGISLLEKIASYSYVLIVTKLDVSWIQCIFGLIYIWCDLSVPIFNGPLGPPGSE